jgi:hypothetical protein
LAACHTYRTSHVRRTPSSTPSTCARKRKSTCFKALSRRWRWAALGAAGRWALGAGRWRWRWRWRKGPPIKNKIGDPRGGVRGQKRTGVRFIFSIFFLIVFLTSPHRETPKNAIKKISRKVGFGLLVECFVKSFRQGVFAKIFLWCFLNSPCRETPKNVLKKKVKKKKLGW